MVWAMVSSNRLCNTLNSLQVPHKAISISQCAPKITAKEAAVTLMVRQVDLAVVTITTTITATVGIMAAVTLEVAASKGRLQLKNATCRCSKTRPEIRPTMQVPLNSICNRCRVLTKAVTVTQPLRHPSLPQQQSTTSNNGPATMVSKQLLVTVRQQISNIMLGQPRPLQDINSPTMPLTNNMQLQLTTKMGNSSSNKITTSSIITSTTSNNSNNSNSNSNPPANTKVDSRHLRIPHRVKKWPRKVKIEEQSRITVSESVC